MNPQLFENTCFQRINLESSWFFLPYWGNCSFFPIRSQIKNANSASITGKADKILINKNASLWKAQAIWDVKDFNLWRGVFVTEPQKTPQEAWRSLCCFRCDMSWGIWYLGVVMPHTSSCAAAGKKNKKKTEFWWKCKKIPGRFNNMLRYFMFQVFMFHRAAAVFWETQHRFIFFLNACSQIFMRWFLNLLCYCAVVDDCAVIDVPVINKSQEKQEILMNIQKQHQHWLSLTWSCSAGKDECML